jgi:hypothetical protein
LVAKGVKQLMVRDVYAHKAMAGAVLDGVLAVKGVRPHGSRMFVLKIESNGGDDDPNVI